MITVITFDKIRWAAKLNPLVKLKGIKLQTVTIEYKIALAKQRFAWQFEINLLNFVSGFSGSNLISLMISSICILDGGELSVSSLISSIVSCVSSVLEEEDCLIPI